MKKITILFIFLFGLTISHAQEICGTPEPKIKGSLTIIDPSYLNRNTPVCINIYYHIIRNSSGIGGINQNQLELITDDLNLQFGNHDISFTTSGFDYIDNTNYQTINNSTEAANLAQVNNFSNSINYYIVDSLWNVGSGFVAGTAINIPSNNLVIRSDRVFLSTSPHEIGHCLNLWHTFQGTASGTSGCAEAINGSNCGTCGDRVCDTPADANTGNSGGYSPDIDNYMSYYTNRDEFTIGQADRIRQSLASSTLLQQVVAPICNAGIDGPNEICLGTPTTFTFNNLPVGASITWSYPTNRMYVISGQGTSACTLSSFTSGTNNIITATIVDNGVTTIYQLSVNILYGGSSTAPTIIVSPNSPNNLICCGQTYSFEHAICASNCSNIEWDHTVYSSNPSDYYAINDTGNTAIITINKNDYSPFIINSKARNLPVNCGNPSSWSNGITRYYGVISARFSGSNKDKINLNKQSPLLERFINSTNTLEVEKVDLYEWMDAQFSDRNLNQNEAEHIINLLSKENQFSSVKIEIFNLTGFNVFSKEMYTSKVSYNLSHLTSGIYFIKYSYGGEIATNKIIIK